VRYLPRLSALTLLRLPLVPRGGNFPFTVLRGDAISILGAPIECI